MMVPDPVLVFGATGTQGGAVARGLLASGFPVHALVRTSSSPRAQGLRDAGAHLVVGDLNDERSLTRAFAGVPVAYAVTTPFESGVEEEERQGTRIINAAQNAGLPWLVLASVASAGRASVPHFRSKARTEARLRDTSVPWTVIAPSYFYENVLGAREMIQRSELAMPLPRDRPLHQVALADLGALVGAVLARRHEHLSVRVEVAGDAPTPEAMASALGARYIEQPLEAVRERSADMAAMYSFLAREGYAIDVPALQRRYPEVPWTSFAEWARSINCNDDN